MRSQRVTFPNREGQRLAARLDLPVTGEPRAFALFAHCFTCTKNLKAVTNISRALTLHNIGVLRFDFTGLGESEGDFADTNFSSNVADLLQAAEFLQREYRAPRILIGHSLGGAAVLQAAEHIPSAVAVATIGAPFEPAHVTHLLADSRKEIEERGEAEVILAGRRFRIKKQFLEDLEMTRMEEKIRRLRKALLVFHAPGDNTVGIDNAARIFKAALHPKSFVSLDDADHLLTREQDSRYVGRVLAAWAEKYVEELAETGKSTPSLTPEANVVIARTGKEGYYTEVMANGHPLVADEPVDYGGTNLGPSPYELLAAALGTCTAMTLRMYADRKQWPLEEVTVRVTHRKIHAEECGDCETTMGKLDVLDREVELSGALTPQQRQRLLEIANKCPVHRTLHSEIVVNTRLRE
ncbi:MAG: OsmC family protein [Calditrichaeota bacterium]|nr:MAG: OsmC family protein [Calditrichota bacterium]